MKKILRKELVGIVLFVCLLVLAVSEALSFTSSHRGQVDIIMVGILLPFDEKGGPNMLKLWIPGKIWTFKVTEMPILGPGESCTNGWTVVNRITPRGLKLVGNKKIIKHLKDKSISKKSFRLNGSLFLGKDILRLTSVEEM